MASESPLQRFEGFVDRWITRYGFLYAVGGTGAVTARLAAITAWLKPWGPIAWAVAFLGGCLVAAIVLRMAVWVYDSWQVARQRRLALDDVGVNVLEPHFDHKTIRLQDFYDASYVPHRQKTFRHCRLVGPGILMLKGNVRITGGEMKHVQFVIVRPDHPIWGATAFDNPTIIDCDLVNLTLLIDRKQYEGLSSHIRSHVPVIHE